MQELYPFVKAIDFTKKLERGPFKAGRPLGVTVHYTGDGSLKQAKEALTTIGYHVLIDFDGTIVQLARLDQRVDHAGKAMWLGRSPNKHHIAVAVIGWGLLEEKEVTVTDADGKTTKVKKLYNYVGGEIDREAAAFRNGHWWHAATAPQERALLSFLRWCVRICKISPADVCGHDECALPKNRKVDPGGALSLSMAQHRAELAT